MYIFSVYTWETRLRYLHFCSRSAIPAFVFTFAVATFTYISCSPPHICSERKSFSSELENLALFQESQSFHLICSDGDNLNFSPRVLIALCAFIMRIRREQRWKVTEPINAHSATPEIRISAIFLRFTCSAPSILDYASLILLWAALCISNGFGTNPDQRARSQCLPSRK
jgi:hypothetical protein